jgi:MFS family permease
VTPAHAGLPAQHRALGVLLLVVFINIAGFGIVIPLLPFYAETYGIAPWQVTILFSAFSIGQFIGEPLWGRLSDKVGRRPVLVGTILVGAIGYLLLAYAPTYEAAFAIRLLGGLAAGNISTVQAYVADISPRTLRISRLALLGSAFGLGFVVGPAIGGLLTSPELGAAGYRPPLLCAAALGLVAAIGTLLFVRESRHLIDVPAVGQRVNMLRVAWDNEVVRLMFVTTLVATAAFSAMESIFALWVNARFQWGPHEVGLIFALIGILSALNQGLLVGRIVRRVGEARALAAGLALTSLSLFGQVLAPSGTLVVVMTAFTVIGVSMTQPAITGMISHATDPAHQGGTLGINGAMSALARIIGPIIAGFLFTVLGTNAPYLFAAAGTLPAVYIALRAGAAVQRRHAAATLVPEAGMGPA